MMGSESHVNEAIDLDANARTMQIDLMNEFCGDALGAMRTDLLGLIYR